LNAPDRLALPVNDRTHDARNAQLPQVPSGTKRVRGSVEWGQRASRRVRGHPAWRRNSATANLFGGGKRTICSSVSPRSQSRITSKPRELPVSI
jgi:hypothetical protein